MVSARIVPFALAFLALASCSEEQAEPVTFYEHIAPIVDRKCVACHTPGGIGGFSLADASTAQDWSAAIKSSTASRQMPPFLLTDDGSCGEFADGGWLTDDELSMIARWADAGAPAGDPASRPPPPPVSQGLQDPQLVVTIPTFQPSLGAEGAQTYDEYRCFELDHGEAEDFYLTAFEGRPDNDGLVHHIAVFNVDMDGDSFVDGVTNGQIIAGLSAMESRPGWPCFGAAGDGVRSAGNPVAWAPGQGVVAFPEGVGYRIAREETLVVQVHYNLSSAALIGQSDASQVAFRTTPRDELTHHAWFIAADDFLQSFILSQYGLGESASIPADQAAHRFSFPVGGDVVRQEGGYAPQDPRPVELVGVLPHMHEAGRKQWVTLDGGVDEGTCLSEVLEWDFGWQRFYFFKEGVAIEPTSELQVTCEWSSAGLSEAIMPGWGTQEEMCLAQLMFATPID